MPIDYYRGVLTPSPVDLAASTLVVIVAIPIELRTGHIPNWNTLGGLLVALGLAGLERQFALHFLGLLAGFVPVLALYRGNWIGGGSVKLIAASSMLGGPWIAVGALLGLLPPYLRGRLRDAEQETHGSPWILLGVLAAGVILVLRPFV